MKKTIITLCIGMIIGLMMGSATGAFAAVGDKVEAAFAKFSFIINGENITLDADPLVYQGSTYLPVRTILNAVGYDVGYLADSRTITADKSVESLLKESDSIFNKEVKSVPSDITLDVIERRIKDAQNGILLGNAKIEYYTTQNDVGDADRVIKAREDVAKLEQLLVDLEGQKAELEAQQ